MDIRKDIIEFIPNLKMLNTLANDILAQVDITDERYKRVIDFYLDSENITKFESMILHLALYENQENRNMLFKSIEEELEKFILLYADGDKYLAQFTDWRIRELDVANKLDELQNFIKKHAELSDKVCACLTAIDSKIKSCHTESEQYEASTLSVYRRKVIEYHNEATKCLNNNYLRFQEICDTESLYEFGKLFDTFCAIANFHNILSKYIPKNIASNNEKVKLILQLHDNAEDYDPECDYNDFELDSDLNIIPKNYSKETLFDMELLSKIHRICDKNQFEQTSQVDFFVVMNMQASSQCLKVKNGEKIRVCYLIHVLSCLIDNHAKRLEWKNELLKHLGISEKYYKSKYTEPIIDTPSKKSEEFVKALREIIN